MRRACLLLLAVVAAAGPALQAADDPLRERIRDQKPPWYDAGADGWKRIEVKPPKAPEIERPSGPGTLGLVDALAWLIVLAAAMGLAWLIWQIVPKELAPARLATDAAPRSPASPAAISHLELGESRDPEEALAAARAAGDWARAMVWLYALLLVRLDRAGAVRLRRGATNRRYAREVETWATERVAPGDLLPALDATIDAFERVFFGRQRATQSAVDALEGRIRALDRALPTESA